MLEEKTTALALHYRRAPHLQREAGEIMQSAAAVLAPHYRLRTGKCVFELTAACCSVRAAIESYMSEVPFAGRTPVFVGDEDTDEVPSMRSAVIPSVSAGKRTPRRGSSSQARPASLPGCGSETRA